MRDYTDNYYVRTSPRRSQWSPLRGPIDVEVCVIGGGIAGLSVALDLSERGRAVALLEKHSVGWGASGRNGGDLSPGFTVSAKDLVRNLGPHQARELYQLSAIGHSTILNWIKKYSIDCGPLVEGSLRCSKVRSKDYLNEYCNFINTAFGIEIEYWSRTRVAETFGPARYGEAIFNPYTRTLHPLRLVFGMSNAIERSGGKIFEGTPATRITTKRAAKRISTPLGEVTAQHVVIACGGYADLVNLPIWLASVPISSFIMVTEPLGHRLKSLLPAPYAVSDIDDPPNYYRPLADTRLMWGGRDGVLEPSPAKLSRMLKIDMVAQFPELREAAVDVAWGGRMCYLRHSMPTIGMFRDGLWCATGFGGLGLAASGMAGRLIGGGIVDRDDRWRHFIKFGLPFAGGPFGKLVAQLSFFRKSVLGDHKYH